MVVTSVASESPPHRFLGHAFAFERIIVICVAKLVCKSADRKDGSAAYTKARLRVLDHGIGNNQIESSFDLVLICLNVDSHNIVFICLNHIVCSFDSEVSMVSIVLNVHRQIDTSSFGNPI